MFRQNRDITDIVNLAVAERKGNCEMINENTRHFKELPATYVRYNNAQELLQNRIYLK